jgi:hypothetical protein
VEFQSKTPAGGFSRECAVTRGLCSITDKSASFLVANNKHVTGRSEICYDSRDSGFAREPAGVGGSMGSGGDCTRPLEHDPEKACPGLIRSGNRFFEKIILKHNVREG